MYGATLNGSGAEGTAAMPVATNGMSRSNRTLLTRLSMHAAEFYRHLFLVIRRGTRFPWASCSR